MSNSIKKPSFCTEDYLNEYLEYLDDLRETGVTNMFGASAYLCDDFEELNRNQAREILLYWMNTFDERHPESA